MIIPQSSSAAGGGGEGAEGRKEGALARQHEQLGRVNSRNRLKLIQRSLARPPLEASSAEPWRDLYCTEIERPSNDDFGIADIQTTTAG